MFARTFAGSNAPGGKKLDHSESAHGSSGHGAYGLRAKLQHHRSRSMKTWRSVGTLAAALLLALAIAVPDAAEARRGGFHGGGFHGGHAFHGGGFRGGRAFHGGRAFRGYAYRGHAYRGHAYRGAYRGHIGRGYRWSGGHHRHYRHYGYGRRWYRYAPYVVWSAPYYYGSYYGSGCDWLYRKARRTGSAYWWDRYDQCVGN
jgi:hypothetical protein